MNTTNKITAAAATTAALAAAAGVGYFFYGSANAKKHRDAAKDWAQDLRKTVVKQASNLKKIDQKAISTVVASAAKMYDGVKGVNKADLMKATGELKKNWSKLKKEVEGAAKKAVKTTTRPKRKGAR